MNQRRRHGEIFLALERADRPITADSLAEQLGVAVRTVYRDIAALRESGVPIDGAAGIGLRLRRRALLPGVGLTLTEGIAIAVALGDGLGRHEWRDMALRAAIESGRGRLVAALPVAVQRHVAAIVKMRSALGALADAELVIVDDDEPPCSEGG